MEDPELQIRGSAVIQTLRKGERVAGSPKNIFLPFGPQFGCKIRVVVVMGGGGGGWGAGPTPGSSTEGSLILKQAL